MPTLVVNDVIAYNSKRIDSWIRTRQSFVDTGGNGNKGNRNGQGKKNRKRNDRH